MKYRLLGTQKLLASDEPVVRSYEQGRRVLEDERFTARPAQANAHVTRLGPPGLDTPHALLAAVFEQLLFAKEATHQRLRSVLDGPLASATARLLPFIQQTVKELVETAQQSGEMDVEVDFARPLAIRTLTRLLGWPSDHLEVAHLAAWSASLIDVTTGHQISQALPMVQEMAGAFRILVASKQVAQADNLASNLALSPTSSATPSACCCSWPPSRRAPAPASRPWSMACRCSSPTRSGWRPCGTIWRRIEPP